MHELLTSDKFKRYFRKQLYIMAKLITDKLRNGKYEEVKGMLEMARCVYTFPLKLSKGDDVKQFVQEAFKEFEVDFVKSYLDS